jgi:hypothetical protein
LSSVVNQLNYEIINNLIVRYALLPPFVKCMRTINVNVQKKKEKYRLGRLSRKNLNRDQRNFFSFHLDLASFPRDYLQPLIYPRFFPDKCRSLN